MFIYATFPDEMREKKFANIKKLHYFFAVIL